MNTIVNTEEYAFDSAERQRLYLSDAVKPSTVIYTRQDSGSGETDWIEVFVAPRRGAIRDITWMVAKAGDFRIKDRGGRWQIPMPGGGYSKGLDVYLRIRQVLGQSESQRNWETL